uniref:Cytochrome P450 4C1-like n=1 Tax=Diabrotica virgifera virgifera TaxID=50390 RepID=A0A6P7GNR4_DIAVI
MYKSKKMRLIDLLLSAKIKQGVIDDKGIKNEVNTFIFAGHDTTANSICHALLLLANEPIVQVSFFGFIFFIQNGEPERLNLKIHLIKSTSFEAAFSVRSNWLDFFDSV